MMISAPYRWFLSTAYAPLKAWQCISPTGDSAGAVLHRPVSIENGPYFAVTKSSSRSFSDFESAKLWVELIAGQACAPSS